MCISHFTLGHSLNLEGEWACKSTMVPLMGENHSCFSEGFFREVLLSQWLPAFSRSEGANMSIVSTRKADPTPKVSPGKALTWLLSLVLAWSCPSCFCGQLCLSCSSGQPLPAAAIAAGLAGTGTGVMPMDTVTHLCRGAVSNTSQLSSPGESSQLPLHSPQAWESHFV